MAGHLAGQCPFCSAPAADVVAANDLAFAIRDRFPVTDGHTLIIPRRHIADWWSADHSERAAVDELLQRCKSELDQRLRPAGYNVGVNNGAAAGQTVSHLHVHLIPRYDGDVADPRGGVRHVIPGRGNYLVGPPPADSPVERGAGAELPAPAEEPRTEPRQHRQLPQDSRGTATADSAAEGVLAPQLDSDLLQRILSLVDTGRRTATYKPALLMAMVELATERLDRVDGAGRLRLAVTDLAERVIELYWPQTRPYEAGLLRQSTTRTSRILDAVTDLRRESRSAGSGRLASVRLSHPDEYRAAVRRVASALARQPIPRLQRPGSATGTERFPRFLYDDSRFLPERGALDAEPEIVLLPGVAAGLARTAGVLRIAVQDVWLGEVLTINRLDTAEERLRQHLFGSSRSSLEPVREALRDLGATRCFWCGEPLPRATHVDHVIPWSYAPRDDLMNLVLADGSCNARKRDRLVAPTLLGRWAARDPEEITALAEQLGWPAGIGRSLAVARSAYRFLADGMPIWLGGRALAPYDERLRREALAVLAAA